MSSITWGEYKKHVDSLKGISEDTIVVHLADEFSSFHPITKDELKKGFPYSPEVLSDVTELFTEQGCVKYYQNEDVEIFADDSDIESVTTEPILVL